MCGLVFLTLHGRCFVTSLLMRNVPGFMCDRVGDKFFLRVQCTLECDGSRRCGYVLFGSLMVLLYPIGKPYNTRASNVRAVFDGSDTSVDVPY